LAHQYRTNHNHYDPSRRPATQSTADTSTLALDRAKVLYGGRDIIRCGTEQLDESLREDVITELGRSGSRSLETVALLAREVAYAGNYPRTEQAAVQSLIQADANIAQVILFGCSQNDDGLSPQAFKSALSYLKTSVPLLAREMLESKYRKWPTSEYYRDELAEVDAKLTSYAADGSRLSLPGISDELRLIGRLLSAPFGSNPVEDLRRYIDEFGAREPRTAICVYYCILPPKYLADVRTLALESLFGTARQHFKDDSFVAKVLQEYEQDSKLGSLVTLFKEALQRGLV
jgi:hypothetical protein